MKYFIKELVDEWRQLRHWPSYIYSAEGIKWRLRNFFILLNGEIVKIISQLRDRPSTLFICFFAALASLLIVQLVSHADIADLLSNAMEALVNLLSILIAAAIFISTLHQKNISKTTEEDLILKKQLLESKYLFSEIYNKRKHIMDNEDKLVFFKGIAAISVHNEYDYHKFKAWHQATVNDINKNDIQHYDKFILYPFDLVMQLSGMRIYHIGDACTVALKLLDGLHDSRSKAFKQSAESLLSSIERYQSAGTHGFYVPVEFAGRHLIRIVSYCSIALGAIVLALLVKKYNRDLFTWYNFHLVDNLFIVSIFLSIIATFLVLRHIFNFIRYPRDSTRDYGNTFDNIHIYEPDSSAKSPDSPYQAYG